MFYWMSAVCRLRMSGNDQVANDKAIIAHLQHPAAAALAFERRRLSSFL